MDTSVFVTNTENIKTNKDTQFKPAYSSKLQ